MAMFRPDPVTVSRTVRPRSPERAPSEAQLKRLKVQDDRLAILTELEKRKGVQDLFYADSFVVNVDQVALEKAATCEKEIVSAIEALPGVYWMIGADAGGFPVYRQEAALSDGDKNKKELFLYYNEKSNEQGWYFSTTLLGKQDEKVIVAYAGKINGDGTTLHIPFWAKKGFKGVQLMAQLNSVQQKATSHIEGLTDRVFELETELANVQPSKKKSADDESDSQSDIGAPRKGGDKGEHSPDKGKKGKGKGGKDKIKGTPGTAGWGNRALRLILAIRAEDWEHAKELAEEYAQTTLMRELIPKYQGGGSKGSDGR